MRRATVLRLPPSCRPETITLHKPAIARESLGVYEERSTTAVLMFRRRCQAPQTRVGCQGIGVDSGARWLARGCAEPVGRAPWTVSLVAVTTGLPGFCWPGRLQGSWVAACSARRAPGGIT